MNCSHCGAANDDNAGQCVACGQALQSPTSAITSPVLPATAPLVRVQVANNLVWAILCTLFCCLPGGIVAIVYAAQVDGKLASGDIAGAQEAARNAAMWCWISVALGIVLCIFSFFFGFGFIGALSHQ